MTDILKIRNFSIIAHIDHGKSTLADRILERTNTVSSREMRDQILDNMDIERERGITIKSQAVRIEFGDYILNLIDTPGHVDFTYEVSRAMAACEGALLLIDSSQGIEAQTLANFHLAQKNNLKIIPVINKIDLASVELDKVVHEVTSVLKLPENDILLTSAKDGTGVAELLDAVIKKIPPPQGSIESPLTALIFDSQYDAYRGVVIYIRMFNGKINAGQKIKFMGTENEFEVQEVGIFKPGKKITAEQLSAGEVGYIIANVKNVRDAHVGDTVTHVNNPAAKALPGYRPAKPMVFCGFYPIGEEYGNLKDALEKLQLNDAALYFEPETSQALGFGFRCGFLGLLHLEIIQERLEREFNVSLIATAPTVVYKVNKTNGTTIYIDTPNKLPQPTEIAALEEPYLNLTIFVPSEFLGAVMELGQERRGIMLHMEYLEQTRVMLTYELPMAEMITDFFDRLKSISRGYASMDYELIGYRPAKLEKLTILINEEPVDALSFIVPQDKAYYMGRELVRRLKKEIPKQMFDVPIQAAIGGKVISRETVKAKRKDVLAKCYGGDVTRKRKLLEKQKEGKKRMKRVGRVDVPQEAFMAVLKINK